MECLTPTRTHLLVQWALYGVFVSQPRANSIIHFENGFSQFIFSIFRFIYIQKRFRDGSEPICVVKHSKKNHIYSVLESVMDSLAIGNVHYR